MRRGYTVFELLVAIIIMMIAAAISYPVIVATKKRASVSACSSNLAEIGMALLMYRHDWDGAEWGTPVQMGLPPHIGILEPARTLRCTGNTPGLQSNGYAFIWPYEWDPDKRKQQWAGWTMDMGAKTVVLQDASHQDRFPRSLRWETWRVIGFQIDGAVIVRRKLGYPLHYSWWEP